MASSKRTSALRVSTLIAPLMLSRCRPVLLQIGRSFPRLIYAQPITGLCCGWVASMK